MAKGLGAGIVSGGFVGAVVLSMLSLYAPLKANSIDAAPKLEAEQPAPAEVAPAVAPDESTSQNSNVAPQSVAPSDANSAAATSIAPDSTQTGQQTSLVVEPAVPSDEIVSQNAADIVAATTDAGSAPVVASDEAVVQTDAPIVQAQEAASPTVIGTEKVADTQVAAPLAEPTTNILTKPHVSSLPSIGGAKDGATLELASADTPITAPVPKFNTPVEGVVTNRLPSLSGGAKQETPANAPATLAGEAAAGSGDVASDGVASDVGALRQFANTVDVAEGQSLFSVVLIDSGEDGLPRADLAKLAIPITIAIDPSAPNAAQIMAQYRAAGIEVVAIVNDLPTAAAPGDVAVALSAYFDVLNQSVALMDPLDGRIQSNRSLLQPVLGSLLESGHGLITYDRGLNTAQQAARREDIPAATVFRVLDTNLESGAKIKRYLDRAAFNANRDGSVVVVGRSYGETVKAIVEWALEKKEAGIEIVPVSAVMLADEAS